MNLKRKIFVTIAAVGLSLAMTVSSYAGTDFDMQKKTVNTAGSEYAVST